MCLMPKPVSLTISTDRPADTVREEFKEGVQDCARAVGPLGELRDSHAKTGPGLLHPQSHSLLCPPTSTKAGMSVPARASGRPGKPHGDHVRPRPGA